MNLKSHLMLSAFLMDLVPVRKAAFLYGSVEPDIILVSYLSGSMHGKSFHGHDYRNMSKRIQSVLARMQEGKGHGLLHSYRLGKLIHYIADSFTFPHNEMFHGSLRSHMLYEDKLEEGLQHRLKDMQAGSCTLPPAFLLSHVFSCHAEYVRRAGSAETDLDYILRLSAAAAFSLTSGEHAAVMLTAEGFS